MKNLYLISQKETTEYDTYDAAVVCAKDAESARRTNPSRDEYDADGICLEEYRSWVKNLKSVRVKLLATDVKCKLGVILSSYNAG